MHDILNMKYVQLTCVGFKYSKNILESKTQTSETGHRKLSLAVCRNKKGNKSCSNPIRQRRVNEYSKT